MSEMRRSMKENHVQCSCFPVRIWLGVSDDWSVGATSPLIVFSADIFAQHDGSNMFQTPDQRHMDLI